MRKRCSSRSWVYHYSLLLPNKEILRASELGCWVEKKLMYRSHFCLPFLIQSVSPDMESSFICFISVCFLCSCVSFIFFDSLFRYGLDVMIDRHYQPFLLEVNRSPDCQRACNYDPEFYNDIFTALFLDPRKVLHKFVVLWDSHHCEELLWLEEFSLLSLASWLISSPSLIVLLLLLDSTMKDLSSFFILHETAAFSHQSSWPFLLSSSRLIESLSDRTSSSATIVSFVLFTCLDRKAGIVESGKGEAQWKKVRFWESKNERKTTSPSEEVMQMWTFERNYKKKIWVAIEAHHDCPLLTWQAEKSQENGWWRWASLKLHSSVLNLFLQSHICA